ncbi:MAG: sulfotransferase family protein [Rhodobacteraceae bacterium]|nr:sulfotransferase family protein [Paracoccaceae bacterium]
MTLLTVNLGLPKSGTTTLGRALKLAGLKVADHRIRPRQTANPAIQRKFVGVLMYRGYFGTGDPGALLDEFDAVSEMSVLRAGLSVWPQTDYGIIEALRRHHPGIRFLATRRAASAMSRSMLAWSDLGTSRLPEGAVPGLPAGFGGTDAARCRWIDGHYDFLQRIFAGADDFLEVDVAAPDARARVAGFVGRDLPWWGKVNANPRAGSA